MQLVTDLLESKKILVVTYNITENILLDSFTIKLQREKDALNGSNKKSVMPFFST